MVAPRVIITAYLEEQYLWHLLLHDWKFEFEVEPTFDSQQNENDVKSIVDFNLSIEEVPDLLLLVAGVLMPTSVEALSCTFEIFSALEAIKNCFIKVSKLLDAKWSPLSFLKLYIFLQNNVLLI